MEVRLSQFNILMEIFSLKESYIVTGAYGLMGKSHVRAILEAGGTVIAIDSNREIEKNFSSFFEKKYHKNIITYVCDITNEDEVILVLEKVCKHGLRIEGLVNNAAINSDYGNDDYSNNSFENFSIERLNNEMSVGLTGAMICTRVFGAEMKKHKKGSIVNVSSDLGIIAPNQSLYATNENDSKNKKPVSYSIIKHSLLGFTRHMSTYWSKYSVRCNALLPGGIRQSQDSQFIKKIEKLIPLGRMANENEYMGSIIYLLSDASSYMTGSLLIVDGGRTAW